LSLIYLTPKNNDYLIDDQLFSTNELYEKINEGPVFLNFTDDCCITCKVNEKVALDNKVFKDFINSKNISYIKADWTNRNDEISSLLESFGRSGIPLYVFYPSKDRQPIILPEVLTEKIVIKYLSEEY
jgi:thiol:disulfide interchange protein DsbD